MTGMSVLQVFAHESKYWKTGMFDPIEALDEKSGGSSKLLQLQKVINILK